MACALCLGGFAPAWGALMRRHDPRFGQVGDNVLGPMCQMGFAGWDPHFHFSCCSRKRCCDLYLPLVRAKLRCQGRYKCWCCSCACTLHTSAQFVCMCMCVGYPEQCMKQQLVGICRGLGSPKRAL